MPERSERRPAIVVVRGELHRAPVLLEASETIIGRGLDADVRIDDARASRRHARVRIEVDPLSGATRYRLTDLDSTNGVRVNDRPIAEAFLQDGDKITIGTHILRFELLDRIDREYRQRLRHLLVHDDLTGLLTGKSFFTELRREVARAAAEGTRFCVLMADIDHFKRVNDSYGHVIGSRTLEELGAVIVAALRPGDIAARFGGEEFAAILSDVDRAGGAAVAESLRVAVERHPFGLDDNEEIAEANNTIGDASRAHHRITISIGVAAFDEDARDPVRLVELADAALYLAKQNGRNRVCEAQAEGEVPTPQTSTQEAVPPGS